MKLPPASSHPSGLSQSTRFEPCVIQQIPLDIYFTHGNSHFHPLSPFIPPSPSSTVSASLSSTSASLVHVRVCVCVCVQTRACTLSHSDMSNTFVTLWTIAYYTPLSIEFSRPEYWSGVPCPPPGDLPNPGIKAPSPVSPAVQADSSPAEPSPMLPSIQVHQYYFSRFYIYIELCPLYIS